MHKQVPITVFIIVVVSLTSFLIYKMRQSNAADTRKKWLLKLFFTWYLCAVAAVTIVPLRVSRTQYLGHHFNFVPVVNSYKRFVNIEKYGDKDGFENFRNNAIGNIIMFIPMGIFLYSIYKKNFRQVIVIAALSSALIEFIQFLNMFIGYNRYVDVDDVILNTAGACIGFLCWRYWARRK